MVARWKWFLIRISKRPWFRASLFSVLGIATALVALAVAPYIPDEVPTKIGSDAVDNILNVLASSMLAVTTFSFDIAGLELWAPLTAGATVLLMTRDEARALLMRAI